MSRPAEAAPALIYKEGDDVIIDGGVLDADAIDGDPLLTADELAAIQGAADPDAENVFATMADVGEGGGSDALADPGNVYAPDTVVAEGYRIAETVDSELRVFEVTTAGTTGSSAFTDYSIVLTPLGEFATGAVHWRYMGIVGQIPWDVAPQLDILGEDASQGPYILGRNPIDDPDPIFTVYPALGDPGSEWEADTAYTAGDRVTAVVDGKVRVFVANDDGTTGATEPAWDVSAYGATTVGDGTVAAWLYRGILGGRNFERPILEISSDGDSDFFLNADQGAGFRFNQCDDTGAGVSGAGQLDITTDGFKVYLSGTSTRLEVTYDPWSVSITGLPIEDPELEGQLYTLDGVLMVSEGV